ATINGRIAQGAAYIFVRDTTTTPPAWTEQAKLTAREGEKLDEFGTSVAIDGDTVVVGAPKDFFSTGQGAAYVFARNGTTWTEQARLTNSTGEEFDRFGFSVAIDGNTVVVGARTTQIGGNPNQGAAYIFERSGTIWSEQQRRTASDGAAVDNFGFSVAIGGDTAVVGAVGDDSFRGSAYVFLRSGTTWSEQQKLTAFGGASGDFFGNSVAIDGNTVLVG